MPTSLIPSKAVAGDLLFAPDAPEFERAARLVIAAKRSQNTRDAYGRDLTRWLHFCRASGVDPACASLEHATIFSAQLSAGHAAASARRRIAALSSIYGKLLKARPPAARANPFHPMFLDWPQAPAFGSTLAVSRESVLAMIAACDHDPDVFRGARDRLLLRLLYDTGMRRGAAMHESRRADLLHEGARTFLRTVEKGRKPVEIALPDETVGALNRWLAVAPDSPWLFPGVRGLGAMALSTANAIVKRRARQAGVTERVHPHAFRAAFVTEGYELIKEGALAERELQAAVSHGDQKTTRRYDRGSRGQDVAVTIARARGRKDGPK